MKPATLYYNNKATQKEKGKVTFSDSSPNGLNLKINDGSQIFQFLGNNIPDIECDDIVILHISPHCPFNIIGIEKLDCSGNVIRRHRANNDCTFK